MLGLRLSAFYPSRTRPSTARPVRRGLAAGLVFLGLTLAPAHTSAVALRMGQSGTGEIVGEITFMGLVQGLPAGALVGESSPEPPYPDYVASVLFQVTLTGTRNLGNIGMLHFLNEHFSWDVGGWIPGAAEPDGLVDGLASSGSLNGVLFSPSMTPGQTSNLVFFMIDTRTAPDQIQLFGSATGGLASAWLPIPEPGSAAALAFGIGLLGALRARCRAAGGASPAH